MENCDADPCEELAVVLRHAHLDSTTTWRLESRQNPHAGKRALRSAFPGCGFAELSSPYVFTVAQIVNLLYRRLPIGWALAEIRRLGQGAVLQDGILRYSRLAVCATNRAEALTTYSSSATGARSRRTFGASLKMRRAS